MRNETMKRILMLTSIFNNEYTSALIKGFQTYMRGRDMVLHIFNAYAISNDSDDIVLEREIYQLPNLHAYDGILLAVNSLTSTELVERLSSMPGHENLKIICIDQKSDVFPSTGIDNYREVYRLVEHLINVHGCHTFNYLGGPEDYHEDVDRCRAFRDCLKAHNLPVEEERILHKHFLNSDGNAAYEEWKEKNLHLPDAVVCANDNMALGYCDAARMDSYLAPRDFRITGFDNIYEGQIYSPSITSINRNWEQLGYDSMARLVDLIENNAILPKSGVPTYHTDGLCIFNESCGCNEHPNSIEESIQQLYSERQAMENLDIAHKNTQITLWAAKDVTQLCDALAKCCKLLHLPGLSVNLNFLLQPSEDKSPASCDVTFASYTDQGSEKTGASLLPLSWENGRFHIFVFSSLHFTTDRIGYCVVPYEETLFTYSKHRKFIDNLAMSLSIIWQRQRLHHANDQLQSLYVRDQLTGLYNRFGYEDLANEFFEKQKGKIFVLFMDLDRLKTYNDNYGHAIGDIAIKGVAECMKSVLTIAPIQVRMGGDEFLAIGAATAENMLVALEEQMNTWLVDYSKRHSLPFEITVSCGHVFGQNLGTPLEQLVKEADHLMYEQKKAKKSQG